MPKPICVKCQRFYRVKHNGFPFVEQMPTENTALPGTQEPHKWGPYKLWVGDMMECEGCGHQLVIGALRPVAEHFMRSFNSWVERYGGERVLRVNDC